MFIAPAVEFRGPLGIVQFDEAEGVAVEALGGIQAQGEVARILVDQTFQELDIGGDGLTGQFVVGLAVQRLDTAVEHGHGGACHHLAHGTAVQQQREQCDGPERMDG